MEGHRVETHAVDAGIEPEAHRLHHRFEHMRTGKIEVRLMG